MIITVNLPPQLGLVYAIHEQDDPHYPLDRMLRGVFASDVVSAEEARSLYSKIQEKHKYPWEPALEWLDIVDGGGLGHGVETFVLLVRKHAKKNTFPPKSYWLVRWIPGEEYLQQVRLDAFFLRQSPKL